MGLLIMSSPKSPELTNLLHHPRQRLELCRAKGFVAVVPDGLDAYSNANGMGLTAADQISYNTFLANAAHSLGLSVGLMNDLNQIGDLLPSFDFFVNE
jgi:hypothetical protein